MSAKKMKTIIICFSLFAFINAASGQDVVTIMEGAIVLVRPDGAIIPVKKGDPMPRLLQGSIVDLQTGSIEVAPSNNTVKITAVDSVVLVKSGDKITITIYPKIQMVGFLSVSGDMEIATGNIKTMLSTGQEVRIGLDKYSGTAYIQSIFGNNVSFIAGSKIFISQNSIAQVSMNPVTSGITITASAGTVAVYSKEGQRSTLNHNESVNISGGKPGVSVADQVYAKTIEEVAAESNKTIEQAVSDIKASENAQMPSEETEPESEYEISFLLNLPVESPSEPEPLEASPYMP